MKLAHKKKNKINQTRILHYFFLIVYFIFIFLLHCVGTTCLCVFTCVRDYCTKFQRDRSAPWDFGGSSGQLVFPSSDEQLDGWVSVFAF